MPGIKLTAPGASAADIARGEAAAQAVFDEAGLNAKDAAVAGFRLEIAERGWNAEQPLSAEPFGLREGEFDAALVWMHACDAAVLACCGGIRPFGWSFELVTEHEA